MIVVAQAAVNESLAAVKAGINNNGTPVGKAVYSFWKSSGSAPSVIWAHKFNYGDLKASSKMASDYLGPKGKVSSEVTLYATESIKSSGVSSYLGCVQILGKVSCDGLEDAVTITEQHDVKIVDLSFPFLDKYALFVKTFCPTINTNNKKFIVQGIEAADRYSFVYLGNRGYPSCKEYPNGANGTEHPPVLLDFDFIRNKPLLGSSYSGPFGFELVDPEAKELSKDKFFIIGAKAFKDGLQGIVNSSPDYQRLYASTRELTLTHKALYDKSKPINVPVSAAHVIVAD